MSLRNVKRGAAPENDKTISFDIALGSADTKYVPVPWAARCTAVYTVIDAAATTTSQDETLAVFNASGTTMENAGGTEATITIAGGSAAGSVDSFTDITTNNSFTAGQALKITADGGVGSTPNATCVFVFSLDNG